jgi:hypothetical protein
MNPPSEQLIRDYLNRLSLAAKTRLEPGDRQALLDDTRAHIEAETGGVSKATAAQVRRVLAAFGDPVGVAENERARIAAATDPAAGSRATGSIRQIWPPPGVPGVGYRPARRPAPMQPWPQAAMQPLPQAAMQPLSPRAANLPVAASRPAYPSNGSSGNGSSGNGSVPPAPSGLARLADPASSADPSGPAGASSRAGQPGSGPRSPRAPRGLPAQRAPRGLPAQRAPRGLPSPGVPGGVPPPRESPAPGKSPPPARPPSPSSSPPPGNSRAPSGEPAPLAGQSEQDKAGQQRTPGRDGTDRGSRDDKDEPGVEFSIERLGPVVYEEADPSWLSQRAGAAAGSLMRFGSALVTIAARAPLESTAVLIMGIGGAIYPPIWLIGALITVISRKWDLRDKWLGLTMPLVVVIFGATLAIVLGGQQTSYGAYVFEAWLAAGRLSRIAAVLSAIYLLWRVYKGPREGKRPPWSMPRRPG